MLSDAEHELELEVRQLRARLVREQRAREVRVDIGRLAARTSAEVSRREVAAVIVEGAAEIFGAGWAVMAYIGDDQIVQFVHGPGVPADIVADWQTAPLETAIPICDVLRGEVPSLTLSNRSEFDPWPTMVAEAERAHLEAFVVRRIGSGERPSGVLAVAWPNEHVVDSEEEALLNMLLDEAGAGFMRSERTEVDGEVAHALQHRVVATPAPSTAHLDIATLYEPGRDFLAVGGDWFDVIPLEGHRTAIVVGDVVGHDVRAAIEMTQVRHVVATHLVAFGDPVSCLRMSDTYLCQRAPEIMATALVMVIEPDRTISIASAGHLPPIGVTADTAFVVPAGLGPPLGSGLGGYSNQTHAADESSLMVAFTDGVVENRNDPIDVSLSELVEQLATIAKSDLTATDVAAFLRDRVDVAHRTDDAAAVVIGFLPDSST